MKNQIGYLLEVREQWLKQLERDTREFKRANEILRKVSAYFALAEPVYGRLQFARGCPRFCVNGG